MKIYVGADYRGKSLLEKAKNYLVSGGYEVIEPFCDEREINDYTDFSFAVGERVRESRDALGILICGSGHGVCIAANKVKGIRCIRALSANDAFLGRDHDGANIMALGADVTPDFSVIKGIIDTFLNTPEPTIERRVKRFEQIKKYEDER